MHAGVDAAIDFGAECGLSEAVRRPLIASGATVVVAIDHGPLLDAIGYRRGRFVRDVLADFSRVATAVLAR